jgi:hypothetical protein
MPVFVVNPPTGQYFRVINGNRSLDLGPGSHLVLYTFEAPVIFANVLKDEIFKEKPQLMIEVLKSELKEKKEEKEVKETKESEKKQKEEKIEKIGSESDESNEIKSEKKTKIENCFKKISCGKNHSLLLSIEGHIITYGSNYWVQIGIGNKGRFVKTPTELNFKQTFKDIATHPYRNISDELSIDNKFYVWGKYGDDCFLTPTEVKFTSFDDIFAQFCRICHKTIDGIFHFDDTFIFNGRYDNSLKGEKRIGRGNYGTVFEVTNNRKI